MKKILLISLIALFLLGCEKAKTTSGHGGAGGDGDTQITDCSVSVDGDGNTVTGGCDQSEDNSTTNDPPETASI